MTCGNILSLLKDGLTALQRHSSGPAGLDMETPTGNADAYITCAHHITVPQSRALSSLWATVIFCVHEAAFPCISVFLLAFQLHFKEPAAVS